MMNRGDDEGVFTVLRRLLYLWRIDLWKINMVLSPH